MIGPPIPRHRHLSLPHLLDLPQLWLLLLLLLIMIQLQLLQRSIPWLPSSPKRVRMNCAKPAWEAVLAHPPLRFELSLPSLLVHLLVVSLVSLSMSMLKTSRRHQMRLAQPQVWCCMQQPPWMVPVVVSLLSHLLLLLVAQASRPVHRVIEGALPRRLPSLRARAVARSIFAVCLARMVA